MSAGRSITVVLFDRFELLDVFGPAEMFRAAPELFSLSLVGPDASPVVSAQGPAVVVDFSYQDAPPPDIVLVPGGIGTRDLVSDEAFLGWLRNFCRPAQIVTSVCTGSGVLAASGLLDGYRATSNKGAFTWAQQQGSDVTWIPQARWIEDRDRWTSSGVAAGIDMALALIASIHGEATAELIAVGTEYDWHRDASWDPFAAKYGLG